MDIPTTLFDFPEEQKWVMNMINNILIEVISSIAESERIKIRQRQREGIDAALQKGVKLGRVPLSKPDNWEAVMQRVENQEITAVEAMRILNMKKSSVIRLNNWGIHSHIKKADKSQSMARKHSFLGTRASNY